MNMSKTGEMIGVVNSETYKTPVVHNIINGEAIERLDCFYTKTAITSSSLGWQR